MALKDEIDAARQDGRDVPAVVEELMLSLEKQVQDLAKKIAPPPSPAQAPTTADAPATTQAASAS